MTQVSYPSGRTAYLVVLYIAAALLPAALMALTGGMEGAGAFLVAARFFGVTGFAMLLFQPLLSARFRWMERRPGLDRLLAFHRLTGITAGVFIILHPLMLALSQNSFSLFTNFDSPWQINAGRITLAVLIIYGAGAVFRAGLKIPFQIWLRMHNALAPLLIAGGFLHSWFIKVQYLSLSMQVLWFLLLLTGLFSYFHLTLYQRLSARMNPWRVSRVNRITGNVWEIVMEPPAGKKPFVYLPGQFLFVTFLRGRGLPNEEHPFTISSSPTEKGHVAVTIKESGDFTASIGKTAPGDRAALMAPYGRFSYLLHPQGKRMVLIAGGIGVTPLLSMIRHMGDSGFSGNTVLFYANRTEDDIAYREELTELAGNDALPGFKVVHVLSSPSGSWSGERGRVNCGIMKAHMGSLEGAAFYICGPPPMMDSVAAQLLHEGVAPGDIHMEKFAL